MSAAPDWWAILDDAGSLVRHVSSLEELAHHRPVGLSWLSVLPSIGQRALADVLFDLTRWEVPVVCWVAMRNLGVADLCAWSTYRRALSPCSSLIVAGPGWWGTTDVRGDVVDAIRLNMPIFILGENAE